MADMAVARQAYSVATAVGASPRVILSLFEAGLVESDFRNLTKAVDHDSLGYLQQRPSQGWPNPTDVTTATKSYLSRAMANEKKYPTYTPGKLAQSVQISAYPDKYDKREQDALALLTTVSGGKFDASTARTQGGGNPLDDPRLTDPFGLRGDMGSILSSIADSTKSMVGSAQNVSGFANQLMKLALPSNFIRAVSGGLGIVFIFIGIFLLGREVRG